MAWGQEKGADFHISALRACQYEIFDFVPCSLPLKTLILLTFSCFLIRRRGMAAPFCFRCTMQGRAALSARFAPHSFLSLLEKEKNRRAARCLDDGGQAAACGCCKFLAYKKSPHGVGRFF